ANPGSARCNGPRLGIAVAPSRHDAPAAAEDRDRKFKVAMTILFVRKRRAISLWRGAFSCGFRAHYMMVSRPLARMRAVCTSTSRKGERDDTTAVTRLSDTARSDAPRSGRHSEGADSLQLHRQSGH